METTAASYRAIISALPRRKDLVAKQPSVALATSYYRANISKAKTVDDFVNDFRLFSFAMTAFGLGDMTQSKGLMRKVLTENPYDPKSLVNRMTDPRIKAFAKAFDFAGKGENATSAPAATTGVIDKYLQQTIEDDAGASNEGVRLALYFKRQAPNVASAYGILADKSLLTVVRTAFNIPSQSSAQSVDTQAAMLKKFVNPKDFQDPVKLDRLIGRFTAMWDMNNASAATPATAMTDYFNAPGTIGLDVGTLLSLQKFRMR